MSHFVDPQLLFGLSAMITSVASLVWSCRRTVGDRRGEMTLVNIRCPVTVR